MFFMTHWYIFFLRFTSSLFFLVNIIFYTKLFDVTENSVPCFMPGSTMCRMPGVAAASS